MTDANLIGYLANLTANVNDYRVVAEIHHGVRREVVGFCLEQGYDVNALFAEESKRIRDNNLKCSADGWFAYKRLSRSGSAFPMSRTARRDMFLLVHANEALAQISGH